MADLNRTAVARDGWCDDVCGPGAAMNNGICSESRARCDVGAVRRETDESLLRPMTAVRVGATIRLLPPASTHARHVRNAGREDRSRRSICCDLAKSILFFGDHDIAQFSFIIIIIFISIIILD